jgi:hypothetical protein
MACPADDQKHKRIYENPPGVIRGEHEHLLPSEPDKADTYSCDAGAVVDRR